MTPSFPLCEQYHCTSGPPCCSDAELRTCKIIETVLQELGAERVRTNKTSSWSWSRALRSRTTSLKPCPSKSTLQIHGPSPSRKGTSVLVPLWANGTSSTPVCRSGRSAPETRNSPHAHSLTQLWTWQKKKDVTITYEPIWPDGHTPAEGEDPEKFYDVVEYRSASTSSATGKASKVVGVDQLQVAPPHAPKEYTPATSYKWRGKVR